jgi:hypothetical protein
MADSVPTVMGGATVAVTPLNCMGVTGRRGLNQNFKRNQPGALTVAPTRCAFTIGGKAL